MKYKLSIIFPLLALLLAACSADDDAKGGREVTLDIPIAIYSANASTASRAAEQGDPGNDVVFKAPLYLYIYAYVSETNNSHEVLVQTLTFKEDELDETWTLTDANTVNECWKKNVRVTFNISNELDGVLGNSRVYAIASRDDLSSVLPQTNTITGYSSMSDIDSIKVDMSKLTSSDLKDIYSTPTKDQSSPVQSTDNGIIVENNKVLTCSTVKLYHVAAKVDFTWEVPSSLRSGVQLQKIECTNLPTSCKIFMPTDNPTGSTGKSVVLDVPDSQDNPAFTVDEGNKWIGRAYAFMLQPRDPGRINYTVTFGGTKFKTNTEGSITPASAAYSNVYTGWYRVVANIKE